MAPSTTLRAATRLARASALLLAVAVPAAAQQTPRVTKDAPAQPAARTGALDRSKPPTLPPTVHAVSLPQRRPPPRRG